jgi:hypothetical protein
MQTSESAAYRPAMVEMRAILVVDRCFLVELGEANNVRASFGRLAIPALRRVITF